MRSASLRLTIDVSAGVLLALTLMCASVRINAADRADESAGASGPPRDAPTTATRPARSSTSETDAAQQAIRSMQSLAARAARSARTERESLWREARAVAADFLREHASNPRRILVRVQDALTLATQGETSRIEAELTTTPRESFGASLDEARGALREALRLFAELDDELAREIPLRRRATPRGGELTADELTALWRQLAWRRGRSLYELALCYAPDSDDRVAMLTQAVQILRQSLAQLAADDPLRDRVRLQLAACYRLLGEYDAAVEALRDVSQSGDAAGDVAVDARVEMARIHLAQRRPRQALEALDRASEAPDPAPADLDLARCEVYLALWREARDRGDSPQIQHWRIRALELGKSIERTHGAAWGRRADALLVQAVRDDADIADPDALARAGDELYRRGQWDQAIATYERAAGAAASQPNRVFELRYKAALVDQNRGEHRPAADKLRALACEQAAEPQAANAHLLAAWNVGQAARRDETLVALYAEILEEHLRLWGDSRTCDTARLWLGRLREHQRRWSPATDAYRGIRRESADWDEAIACLLRCYDRQLAAAGGDRGQAKAVARAAAEALATLLDQRVADPAAIWTASDRGLALSAARCFLYDPRDGAARAESLLRAGWNGRPAPDAAWQNEALPLLMLALAAQKDKQTQAQQMVPQLADVPAAQIASLIERLSQLDESPPAPAGRSGPRGTLRLAVVDALAGRRDELDAAARADVERWRAEALVAAGQSAPALAAYRALAARRPTDDEVQAVYGDLLLESDDSSDWQAALDHWRRVASRARPQSEMWYHAKFAVAAALWRMGQPQDAAARIRYLLATTPAISTTPWAEKFADLLRKCQ